MKVFSKQQIVKQPLVRKLLVIPLLSATLGFAAPGIAFSDIKLFDKEAKEQKLAGTKDKLLVVLWATWCPDCKTKLKGELKNLKDDPAIDVLALNTEKNMKRVQEFIKDEDVTLPVAFDKENNFRKTLELFTVPAWAVFDRKADGSLTLVDKGSPFDTSKINTALGKVVLK